MITALLILFLLQTQFTFRSEQSVYIIGLSATHADLSQAKVDLEIERKASDEFKSQKEFKIAKALNQADFVFLALVDRDSEKIDELALALLPKYYLEHRADLVELKNHALWSDSGKLGAGNAGKSALIAGTLGVGALFVKNSVVRDIVKGFHSDVLPKKK
jgi:hypothetical protein